MIGLYLVPKHAELIYQGKKKGIVKRRHFRTYLRNDLELITKIKGVGYSLGKIKLSPPKYLTLKEIKKLYPLHLVTDEEIKEWFPYAKKLYYYDIEKFEKYDKPKIIQIKPGVQTIQHFLYSENFIKDIESYNPSALRKKVLQDDWRLVNIYYSRKKKGKKLKFSMEQILSLAKKIYQELLRRGIHPGQTKLSRELIQKIKKEFSKYLPIYRGSESKEGEEIKLDKFLEKWNNFIIHKDFIQLVGSLANWEKTVGDIDILIKAEPGTTLWNLATWRILRAYPEYQDRFHFIPYNYGNWQGPFTCHIPLGDLCVNIDKERFKRIEMSKQEIDLKRDPNFKKYCLLSEKEDKLVPFRPFFQEKPQHGRNVGEAYNLDSLVEVVNKTWPNWKEKGIYIGIKRDGVTCQVHFDNGKVKIWTEDGSDVTENLPTIVSQFAKKPGKCVVIGELEWYHEGKHMPRSDTAGIINHKGDPREKEVRITIYDKLYSDSYKGDFGDMHKKPYSFRREQYTKIHEDKNIKISNPEYLVKNEKSLRKYVEHCSNKEGSEGAMLKLATAPYPLTIHPYPPTMIKFKKEYQVIARVVGVHRVKGADAYVYDVAVDEDKFEKV